MRTVGRPHVYVCVCVCVYMCVLMRCAWPALPAGKRESMHRD